MTSLVTVKKEVEKLKERVLPKPEDRIVVRMCLPDGDPRHDMTEEELARANPENRFIIKPLKKVES